MNVEQPFFLGPYTVLPQEDAILINTKNKQSIQPKVTEVLCYLVLHYPRVVSRAELIEHVWGNNELVGEKALTNTIWQIRQCFKYPNNEICVIETIRKRGYKLLVKPQAVNVEQAPSLSSKNDKSNAIPWLTTLFLITMIIGLLSFYLAPKKAANATVTQITKDPGSELFVSPSPDGKKVIYIWANNAGRHLYLKELAAPQVPPIQLTITNASYSRAVWSLDQQYIYFLSTTASKCFVIKFELISKKETKLATCPVTTGVKYIAMSSDGRTLAFNSKVTGDIEDGIYFLNLNNNQAKPERFSCQDNCAYRERDIAFSPNGEYVAVARRASNTSENIFIVNLKTKAAQQVTFKHNDIEGMTWHKSNDLLVFGSQKADKHSGFILNLKTLKQTPLNISGFGFPSFSADGSLFYQKRRETYYIAGYDLSTSVGTSIYPVIESEFSNKYPTYSEVSQELAYLSNESGYYEVWLSDIYGSNRRQLTNLKKNAKYPLWSNNGKKLVFASAISKSENEIYVYNSVTKKINRLNITLDKFGRPTWHPNNKDLVIRLNVAGKRELYLLDTNTLMTKKVTDNNGRFGYMDSDKILVYVDNKKELYKVDINEPHMPVKLLDRKQFGTRYGWSIHNHEVYFKSGDKAGDSIKRFNIGKKLLTDILYVPTISILDSEPFSMIPLHKKLLFTKSLSEQSNINQLHHPLFN
ncbi:winged helix-turn-helix domain-containing protein [Pseudoalteromonas sp. SCSIO 43210]